MLDTKKIPFSKIVKSQLPSYVREEFPLIGEFLTQYYFGQEVQGGTFDLIQNIDEYLKISWWNWYYWIPRYLGIV